MIRISNATGSKEFKRTLIRAGAPCVLRSLKQMPFADFWFWGHGPKGRCKIGVERKTVSEIVSAIGDNRFTGHQLPGLLQTYAYTFVVIEGDRYIDLKTGLLNPQALRHLPLRAHVYQTVQKFELTLMLKGGVRVIYTKNKTHTALFLCALHEWFSEPWAKHKSVYQVEENKPDTAILEDRTMKRKVANQLTNLAWVRTVKADKYFPSIASMVVGDPQFAISNGKLQHAIAHWQSALGIKTGTKIASAIVEVCHRRDDVKSKGR